MAERFSEFDAEKAAEALGAEPHETRDVAYGDGHAITAGDTTLEVYKNARVARVTTPDARIELFRVPTYQVSPQRLVFQQGEKATRTRLLVRSDGRVWYYPGLRAPESSRTAETAPSDEVISPAPTKPSTQLTGRPDDTLGAAAEQKEPEEQQLIGRLGRDPWFGIRGEEPAAGFPLAVNDEEGKATWHRVLVTGELVDQIRAGVQQGQIKRGRLVQVSGTEIVQSQQTPKGGTRTTTEFHATSVVRLKNAPAANPQAR
jgi:Single-strand binding protein family